jgi:uncharacterized protein YndB with AHSA1/START domain
MEINTSIDISSKPEEVFSWIDNPDKAMRWQKGVKSGEIIKETSEKIGTTFKEELEEQGKSLTMFGEITDYVPNKLISFHLESKIHNVYVNYSVVGDTNRSTVKVESKIKWKFPMNVISLFIGHKMKANILRQTLSELTELKKLCETK